MRVVAGVFRFILIILLIPFIYLVATLSLPRLSQDDFRTTVEKWSRRLLSCMGVRVESTGGALGHAKPGGKGVLLLSNHISFLDVFVLNAALCSRFVAKAEIGGWPVFGAISRGTRTIFIERGKRRALVQMVRDIGKVLNSGENVIFFPEGTTSTGEGLLPLHANLIEAAVTTGAVVQPVVLRYRSRGNATTRMAYVGSVSIFQCLWRVVTTPGASVEVKVLSLIDSAGRDRHGICEKVSAAMAAAIGVPDPTPRRLSSRTTAGTVR